MAAQAVAGGDAICDVIEDLLDEAQLLVEETSWEASQSHLADLQARAAVHPRWTALAGDLSMWADEQGNTAFGVHPTNPRAPEAMLAEYGDENNAPAPLLRMGLLNGVADMGWSMREAFQQAGF